MAAAVRVGQEAASTDVVVVLVPDSGRGYLSRVFNDDWMADFGFLRTCDLCVAAVLDRAERVAASAHLREPRQLGARSGRAHAQARLLPGPGDQERAAVRGGGGAGRGRRARAHGCRLPRPGRARPPGRRRHGKEACRPWASVSPSTSSCASSTRLPPFSSSREAVRVAVLTRTDVLTFLSPGEDLGG